MYRLIVQIEPQRAGKITGMLLEATDISETVNLLEDTQILRAKVEEAMAVLAQATA